MSEPETRLVLLEPREVDRQLGFTSEQKAIPWCTTHDEKLPDGPELKKVEPRCWFDYFYGVKDSDGNRVGSLMCVVSTGGPDHYWWKDT